MLCDVVTVTVRANMAICRERTKKKIDKGALYFCDIKCTSNISE